ncbi:MAG: Crp/Fnr family transcriptional regulator [Flavobacteriaceae bacterium]|uniref:Crp/Fnr family transcriptional regulator n=1 Tax=Flagellimonas algarum TaxID=3230298 RepID=UPI00339B87BD|nr:Crp/Fnr family transcriptional regulator [Flavobacteriaceae bacterium]
MQMLREYFNGFGTLPDADMDFLLGQCRPREIAKGELLITPHQRVDSIYFLESGYLHYYTHTDMGERITLKVVRPNVCWTILDNFMNQTIAQDECVALTDVRFCELKREDYLRIKSKNDRLANFIYTIIEQMLSAKVLEANNKSKMTVEQRYLDLLNNDPEMVRIVPVTILASLIGTSRETLHRIRRKLAAA